MLIANSIFSFTSKSAVATTSAAVATLLFATDPSTEYIAIAAAPATTYNFPCLQACSDYNINI